MLAVLTLTHAALCALPAWWLWQQAWPLVWRLLAMVALWQVVVGLTALIVYAVDKRRAQADAWRVPERDLHGLALTGGWLGAWLGRRWCRHKTRKPVFTWVIAGAGVLWVVIMLLLVVAWPGY